MGQYHFQSKFSTTPLIVLGVVDGLRHWVKDLYFNEEPDSEKEGTGIHRVVFALNDFALRKRCSDMDTPYAMLPFINFKHTDIKDFEDFGWTSQGFNQGFQTDDGYFVKLYPTMMTFECSIWVNKSADLFMAQKLLSKIKKRGKVYFSLSPYLKIGEVPISANVIVDIEQPKINQFSDKDWLKTNKIQTLSFSFTARFQDYLISAEPEVPVSVYQVYLMSMDKQLLDSYWLDADEKVINEGIHLDADQEGVVAEIIDELTPPTENVPVTPYVSMLPFYATTLNIAILSKQPVQKHGSEITRMFVEEDGLNKQSLELPLVWGDLIKVEQFNTFSGRWDTLSLSLFTVSTTVRYINDVKTDYVLYTYNGSAIGERQLRFSF